MEKFHVLIISKQRGRIKPSCGFGESVLNEVEMRTKVKVTIFERTLCRRKKTIGYLSELYLTISLWYLADNNSHYNELNQWLSICDFLTPSNEFHPPVFAVGGSGIFNYPICKKRCWICYHSIYIVVNYLQVMYGTYASASNARTTMFLETLHIQFSESISN